jgi:hypothetical protein
MTARICLISLSQIWKYPAGRKFSVEIDRNPAKLKNPIVSVSTTCFSCLAKSFRFQQCTPKQTQSNFNPDLPAQKFRRSMFYPAQHETEIFHVSVNYRYIFCVVSVQ